MRTPSLRSMFQAAAMAVMVCSVGWTLQARTGQSLKDAARASGGRTILSVDFNMPFLPLSRVITDSDVIVQGRVTKVDTRLSSDEEAVLTYVTLTPFQFFKGGSANTASAPGPVPPVVFSYRGGTVKLDGLEIAHRENTGVDPALGVGDEVIALLEKGDETGALGLSHGGYGLLRIHGDKVAGASDRIAKVRPLESDQVSEVQKAIRRDVSPIKQ